MRLDNGFKLAEEIIKGGASVNISPTVQGDTLEVVVAVSDLSYITGEQMNKILDTANEFDCNVGIKNNTVIYA